jgi:hypothetical protein
MIRRYLTAILLGFMALGLSACLEEKVAEPTARQEQARISADAANSLRFNANAERENIINRHRLTADSTLLGYILLMNEAGQPIMYEGVRGKVTTSGSRLTAPDVLTTRTGNSNYTMAVTRGPSDIGTYDTGTAVFIYYWNTDGTFRQWSGQYLYSTQPIRLRQEPLVVNVSSTPTPAR